MNWPVIYAPASQLKRFNFRHQFLQRLLRIAQEHPGLAVIEYAVLDAGNNLRRGWEWIAIPRLRTNRRGI